MLTTPSPRTTSSSMEHRARYCTRRSDCRWLTPWRARARHDPRAPHDAGYNTATGSEARRTYCTVCVAVSPRTRDAMHTDDVRTRPKARHGHGTGRRRQSRGPVASLAHIAAHEGSHCMGGGGRETARTPPHSGRKVITHLFLRLPGNTLLTVWQAIKETRRPRTLSPQSPSCGGGRGQQSGDARTREGDGRRAEG
jgi:hypothetical protein